MYLQHVHIWWHYEYRKTVGWLFKSDEVPQNCDVGMPDYYSRFPYLTIEDGDCSLYYQIYQWQLSDSKVKVDCQVER
jgi:hypothetical protein